MKIIFVSVKLLIAMKKAFLYLIFSLLFCFTPPSNIYAQQDVIDSLKQELEKADVDSSKKNIHNYIIRNYLVRDKNEEALKYALQYYDIMVENKSIQYSNYMNLLGGIYDNRSVYDSAIIFLQKAMESAEYLEDYVAMGRSYLYLGGTMFKQGRKEEALNYFLKLRKISEQNLDIEPEAKNNLASAYYSIAMILKEVEQDKSIGYYLKAAEIFEEAKKFQNLAITLRSIGYIYARVKPDSAIYYHQRSVKILREIKSYTSLAYSLSNIAFTYTLFSQPKKAIPYLRNALDTFRLTQHPRGEIIAVNGLAEAYITMGKLDSAQKYISEALSLNDSINDLDALHETYKMVYQVDSLGGNYLNALNSYIKYRTLRDTLLKNEIVSELTAKYETEKKKLKMPNSRQKMLKKKQKYRLEITF